MESVRNAATMNEARHQANQAMTSLESAHYWLLKIPPNLMEARHSLKRAQGYLQEAMKLVQPDGGG